jgi:nickel/cobalt exporter
MLLGALHGLEPGHSKTMMAAFIVAIRGTVTQTALLGLAATVSHTLVVWGIALGGMYLWQGVNAETFEPYFQLASAAIIIGIALWMLWRTWKDQQRAKAAAGAHAHGHDPHSHGHAHGEDIRQIDTGHGVVAIEVFEDDVPPHWRIRTDRGHAWAAEDVTVVTERPDGGRQAFTFVDRGSYLESVDQIPEPHEFMARVSLGHGGHTHDYDLSFVEGHDGHDHIHEELRGLDVAGAGFQDAHELAHANDIRRQFADRNVDVADYPVRPDRRPDPVPCRDHRAAAVPAA